MLEKAGCERFEIRRISKLLLVKISLHKAILFSGSFYVKLRLKIKSFLDNVKSVYFLHGGFSYHVYIQWKNTKNTQKELQKTTNSLRYRKNSNEIYNGLRIDAFQKLEVTPWLCVFLVTGGKISYTFTYFICGISRVIISLIFCVELSNIFNNEASYIESKTSEGFRTFFSESLGWGYEPSSMKLSTQNSFIRIKQYQNIFCFR